MSGGGTAPLGFPFVFVPGPEVPAPAPVAVAATNDELGATLAQILDHLAIQGKRLEALEQKDF